MDPQSLEGRPCETTSNPILAWILERFPGYTKGEILFFMLPLAVRHKIYKYHTLDCRPTLSDKESKQGKGPARPRKVILPLAQTCRTFRMEMKGINASRVAVFKNEGALHNLVKVLRKQALTPFVSSITIDLSASNTQIRSLDSLRSIIVAASDEFKFVQWLTFHANMAKQRVASPLKTLMTDGTMERFAQLEKVSVQDLKLDAIFRACDEESKELIRAKIQKWTQLHGIDEKLDSDLLVLAGCRARLDFLNTALALIMGKWRKDSGIDQGA